MRPPRAYGPGRAEAYKGISYFLLDMNTPGVTVRPLVDMTGRHTFNELFMENVRVPRDALVGELNRGWYIAAATLDFERSGINRVVAGIRAYEELTQYARETKAGGQPLMAQETVRNKIAELGIEFVTGRLLALPRGLDAGTRPDPERRSVDVEDVRLGATATARRGRRADPRPRGPACARQQVGTSRRPVGAILPLGIGAHRRGRDKRDHARDYRGPRLGLPRG